MDLLAGVGDDRVVTPFPRKVFSELEQVRPYALALRFGGHGELSQLNNGIVDRLENETSHE
jgi:hypothetical protein